MNRNPEKEYLLAFGKNLRDVRKRKGYTQEKLAYEANIELRQIGRIERGEINTGILSVKIISDILKINQIELFDFSY